MIVIQMCTGFKPKLIGSKERPNTRLKPIVMDNNRRTCAGFKLDIVGNNKRSNI